MLCGRVGEAIAEIEDAEAGAGPCRSARRLRSARRGDRNDPARSATMSGCAEERPETGHRGLRSRSMPPCAALDGAGCLPDRLTVEAKRRSRSSRRCFEPRGQGFAVRFLDQHARRRPRHRRRSLPAAQFVVECAIEPRDRSCRPCASRSRMGASFSHKTTARAASRSRLLDQEPSRMISVHACAVAARQIARQRLDAPRS